MADAITTLRHEIEAHLATVRERISAAARLAGRNAAEVTLIAVSKQQPDERIAAALAAGQRVFGENRVQEGEAHWRAHRDAGADVELHLIGPLQTNKVRDAVASYDVIQTVDRPKLARHLADEFARIGEARRCFIEVNTGEEPQKAGVVPADADAFIAECRALGLPLEGLMCIPPFDEEPSPHFALLRTIAERNGLAGLSMGMSADYEAAVELGATHVRVGTAIFGERQPRR
jgi:pyridoxal phosphate enzyme (YggS family)